MTALPVVPVMGPVVPVMGGRAFLRAVWFREATVVGDRCRFGGQE
jgi:hypothetical protein